MITLIIDRNEVGESREIRKNLTLKELGEALIELSAKYILVFDTVMSLTASVGCDLFVAAVSKR